MPKRTHGEFQQSTVRLLIAIDEFVIAILAHQKAPRDIKLMADYELKKLQLGTRLDESLCPFDVDPR